MSRLSEKPSEKLDAFQATPAADAAEFSLEQRRVLLGLAHEAIRSALQGRPLPEAQPDSDWLSEPRGVFTTLYLKNDVQGHPDHQLRGCVGYALPVAPLFRAVTETARAAAFDDSRFSPVSWDEALALEISLSILSPLLPIHPDEVRVGRHGLLISEGARHGLLLPQVPVENGWDRETFLEQTCRKAGLPQDAWRKTATIEAFTAEVFGDADIEALS
jgi:AmmeMemoRadiSam system protein A